MPGTQSNIKSISYQHRKSHCGYKMILWSSYLHNGISLLWVVGLEPIIPISVRATALSQWGHYMVARYCSTSIILPIMYWLSYITNGQLILLTQKSTQMNPGKKYQTCTVEMTDGLTILTWLGLKAKPNRNILCKGIHYYHVLVDVTIYYNIAMKARNAVTKIMLKSYQDLYYLFCIKLLQFCRILSQIKVSHIKQLTVTVYPVLNTWNTVPKMRNHSVNINGAMALTNDVCLKFLECVLHYN